MLRWLALALLLLNAVAYLWWSQGSVPQTPVALVAPPEGELLELLGVDMAPGPQAAVRANLEPIVIAQPLRSICVLVGSFSSLDDAGATRRALAAASSVAPDLVWRPILVRTDYWVHLGPLPSRDAALIRLRELHAAGVDSFIIAEGELTNAISLGYFTREQLAQTSLREWRQKGLDANVRAIPRHDRKLWILLTPDETGVVGSALLEELPVSDTLQVEKNFCDSIATLEKFE